jgi:hypothetical protein
MKRFLLHVVEFQLAMGLGALLCYLLGRLVPASSTFATVYYPGSYLFAAGDVFFLAAPVVAWMLVRNHGRLRSLEMGAALLAPVAAVAVWGELAGSAYRLWLITGMYPAMSVGMLGAMLYRRGQFSRPVGRPSRPAATPTKASRNASGRVP